MHLTVKEIKIVIDQKGFIEGIARGIYDIFNVIPRIKTEQTIGNKTFEIHSFSNVAVEFLLSDDITTENIIHLVLSYFVVCYNYTLNFFLINLKILNIIKLTVHNWYYYTHSSSLCFFTSFFILVVLYAMCFVKKKAKSKTKAMHSMQI